MNSTRSTTSAGFTLIELMVSIFLLLLIMIGVNTVFSTTSNTISAGQTQSEMTRNSRAILATLNNDFGAMASDGPAIIIKAEQIFAFNSPADAAKDLDGLPYTVPDLSTGADAVPTQSQSGAIYNGYSHRQDRMSFFTRHLQRRQTGNDGTYLANQSSLEQWVWLGHLRIPDNSGNLFADPPTNSKPLLPGSQTFATNPNGYYANQWYLGRMAMQLAEPTGATSTFAGTISDSTGGLQAFVYRAPGASASSLAPLATSSNACKPVAAPGPTVSFTNLSTSNPYLLQESRLDLAGTSVAGYSTILSGFLKANAPTAPDATADFWTSMMAGPTSRFQAFPYPSRPFTSATVAAAAPIMTASVSQFIVEYAGDFVTQTDTGSATDGDVTDCYFYPVATVDSFGTHAAGDLKPSGQDGKIDFNIKNRGSATAAVKSIRWYGMPRSTSGNTTINVSNGDVCPFRDTLRSCTSVGYSALTNAPFERVNPTASTTGGAGNNLLVSPLALTPTNYLANTVASGGMPPYSSSDVTAKNGFFYTAAWGPTDTVRPKLYRITMTIEDPSGRLPNGQTYEYVFAAP